MIQFISRKRNNSILPQYIFGWFISKLTTIRGRRGIFTYAVKWAQKKTQFKFLSIENKKRNKKIYNNSTNKFYTK